MGAITGTLTYGGEFSGVYRIVGVTATVASASDTITLTAADHGITAITQIVGAVITAGQDAAFTAIGVSFSGLVLTVTSVEQDGTASTDWTGTTVAVTVIGTV